ncbi:MAG: hypothetical protein VX033_07530 [Verrucomicrobiota bacterium]|nr:hypothetical protein [Verrucomicrobiota bacterium]
MIDTHKALVLSLESSGESFLKLTVLSPESGTFYCLKRIAKKKSSTTDTPDLFDTAEIDLETTKQGNALFVSNYRTLIRRSEIGQNYQKLLAASEFSAVLATNSPQMGDYANLYHRVERSLDAFCERPHPTIVLLKSLYLLLKDEGYPVRESWWPNLPSTLREAAKNILNQPTPNADLAIASNDCQLLTKNLYMWLQRETDLIVPKSLS